MSKFPAILFLLSALSLSAQTAAELDIMLETKAVSAAKAARFVLGAAELLPGASSSELSGSAAEAAAYEMASAKGWVNAGAADAITMRDAAFLIMNAFGFSGGVMYTLFPNPRYAYREMVYKKLIQGRVDPAMTVSGQRLLQIIGKTLSYTGENEQIDEELHNIGAVN